MKRTLVYSMRAETRKRTLPVQPQLGRCALSHSGQVFTILGMSANDRESSANTDFRVTINFSEQANFPNMESTNKEDSLY